jgi:hypothetical protein
LFWLGASLFGALLVFTQVPNTQAQDPPQAAPEKSKGFEGFVNRVKTYMNLRSTLEGTVPKPKSNTREDLLAHEKALTDKIVDARKDAKVGDIFTPEAAAEFKKQIAVGMQSEQAAKVRKTIRSGEPVDLQLHVNQIYPENVPFTTVPSTLLLKFPSMPDGVQYKIVGRTLALVDMKLRIVIDCIPDALPASGS